MADGSKTAQAVGQTGSDGAYIEFSYDIRKD
jgi:hypothetical protein